MRVALSMLLGEHVEATQVEHADVVGFQVVCPCCRESVFKVARSNRNGGTQFFSHRVARPGTEDCERRVAALSRSTILSYDSMSRGQTLKAFSSVLRQAVDLDIYAHSGATPRRFHEDLAKCPAVGNLCRNVAWRLKDLDIERDLTDLADSVIGIHRTLGWEHDTGFATQVQKSIALDLLSHLVTHQGERSRDHLVRHALGLLQARYERGGRSVESDVSGRLNVMDVLPAFMTRNGHASRAMLSSFHAVKLKGYDKSLYDRFEEHVIGSMLSVLVRLPYRRMLENHRSGTSPIRDIEPTMFLSLARAPADDERPRTLIM